jgi:hypothetical protein
MSHEMNSAQTLFIGLPTAAGTLTFDLLSDIGEAVHRTGPAQWWSEKYLSPYFQTVASYLVPKVRAGQHTGAGVQSRHEGHVIVRFALQIAPINTVHSMRLGKVGVCRKASCEPRHSPSWRLPCLLLTTNASQVDTREATTPTSALQVMEYAMVIVRCGDKLLIDVVGPALLRIFGSCRP